MKKQLLEYSYTNKLSHIPSALSMLTYVDLLFTEKFVTPNDIIILGKPFGAQTYYLVWQKLGYLTDIEKLSLGVKHDEIDFVTYSEETMGNALGVAAGVAMTTSKQVWVNMSDAVFQMGNALEAVQYIGHNKLKNIFVTIDFNNAQCTGKPSDILSVEPVINFFREYGWSTQEVNGHDADELRSAFLQLDKSKPNVVFCRTVKGYGVASIIKDIPKWHYKKIESSTELQSLVAELAVI
jgi:transketolase